MHIIWHHTVSCQGNKAKEQGNSISLALYPGLHFSSAMVNGTPGILVWSKETLLAVIACEMTEEQITNLYEVINPDKLASIQKQMQPHE